MDKEYIDREAVVEKILLIYCAECNSYNGVRCRACEFDDSMSLIEDIPAADVAPVVHGEWVNCKNGYATCSRCRIRQRAVYDADNEQHYCGHCGAKMDGGKV